jgi:ERCC4-type nuclease
MIISPTEPPALRALGTVSMRGEEFGADVLWIAQRLKWGVQRKEIGDFVSSVQDGRLGEQVMKMKELDVAVLMIEGRVNWTRDGELVLPWGRFSKKQWCGVLWSCANEGMRIEHTDSVAETVERIGWLESWSRKAKHNSLKGRGNASSTWGTAGNRDFQIHLLSGLPGIGHEIASRMVDQFGGSPLGWRVTMDEMMQVKGLGKGRVERMFRALASDDEMG